MTYMSWLSLDGSQQGARTSVEKHRDLGRHEESRTSETEYRKKTKNC